MPLFLLYFLILKFLLDVAVCYVVEYFEKGNRSHPLTLCGEDFQILRSREPKDGNSFEGADLLLFFCCLLADELT